MYDLNYNTFKTIMLKNKKHQQNLIIFAIFVAMLLGAS